MKILYDHQAFSNCSYGGICRYFFELMRHYYRQKVPFELAAQSINNHYLESAIETKDWCSNTPRSALPMWRRCRRAFSRFFGKEAERSDFLFENKRAGVAALERNAFDIFHPTYYDPYFLEHLSKKPFVLTVHDCIHELFPEFLMTDPAYRSKERLAQSAAKVIAVSERTKEDLLRIYDVDERKITVVYHGNSLDANVENANLRLPSRYLLFVGDRTIYKNFYLLARVIASLAKHDRELSLLCMGGPKFSQRELRFFELIGIRDQVRWRAADDPSLVSAYRRALLFVYPSLYEGFGIPLLEAFACGCPVACSRTSCFPEIAGDAAAYFEPKEFDSMKETIAELLRNEDLRKRLRTAGYKRLQRFSWEQCAHQTMRVYESCL